MNKEQIIESVAGTLGVSKRQAATAVNAVISVIISGLAAGERVILAGLGTFTPAKRSARRGRNPQTGEEITISERKTIKFKPWKSLVS